MTILYLSIGMASPLSMSLELCRRLRDRGHTVTYASHEDLSDRVGAHGHHFIRLHDPEPTSPIRLRRALADGREQCRRRRASIDDDGPVRLLDAVKPDRILADVEMHVAILKLIEPARTRGIPLLLTMAIFPVHPAPGRPPLHVTDPPADGAPGRRRLRRKWRRTRLERTHFEWKQRLARWRRLEPCPTVGYFCFDVDDLRDVARRHGVDLGRETTRRHWLRPFMYTRLPVLCWNARELDWPQGSPPEELPQNVRYVGPMVQRPRFAQDHSDDLDEEFRAWRRFDSERGADRPLVYASLGSFWAGDVDLLRGIVEIFARHPAWDLVLGLGRQARIDDLGPLPPNVLALPWAPQVEVLERADAAVVHGGVATLNECALLGVPTVVYSTGFVEQHGNAARIGFHGIGRVASTPHDIKPSIRHVLEDPAYRRRLDALRPSLERYAQQRVALGLIESAEVLPA
ncbi:MAG: nucleotide disphospho-sugar-binding domain-containing protein [Acidobacteriota bacterium]